MEKLKILQQAEKDVVLQINGVRLIQEKEKNKIQLMRTFLEKHDDDASCKEVDDSTLRRFLLARDLNIEKASYMYLKYRKWRQTFIPNGYISANDIVNELAQSKVLMQGTDKMGRLIIIVVRARHFKNKAIPYEFKG